MNVVKKAIVVLSTCVAFGLGLPESIPPALAKWAAMAANVGLPEMPTPAIGAASGVPSSR